MPASWTPITCVVAARRLRRGWPLSASWMAVACAGAALDPRCDRPAPARWPTPSQPLSRARPPAPHALPPAAPIHIGFSKGGHHRAAPLSVARLSPDPSPVRAAPVPRCNTLTARPLSLDPPGLSRPPPQHPHRASRVTGADRAGMPPVRPLVRCSRSGSQQGKGRRRREPGERPALPCGSSPFAPLCPAGRKVVRPLSLAVAPAWRSV